MTLKAKDFYLLKDLARGGGLSLYNVLEKNKCESSKFLGAYLQTNSNHFLDRFLEYHNIKSIYKLIEKNNISIIKRVGNKLI